HQNKYIEKTTKEVLNAINSNVKYVKDPFKVLSDRGKYDGTAINSLDGRTRKKLDINGVYLKDVPPEDMIKLEIDGTCIGYLYINRVNSAKNVPGMSSLKPASSMLSALTSVSNPDAGSPANHSINNKF